MAPTPLKVEILIDRDTGQWDKSLLDSFFTAEDSNIIGDIHLAINKCDNELVWTRNLSGELTVKTAYASLIKNDGLVSDIGGRDPIWMIIWSADVDDVAWNSSIHVGLASSAFEC